jgi:hypothetical protein
MNIEQEKKKGKMVLKVSVLLWIIGFVMVLSAIYLEFWGPYQNIADSTSSRMLMSLKLGGIGFTLAGIFLALVVISKILVMMPEKLSVLMKKRK